MNQEEIEEKLQFCFLMKNALDLIIIEFKYIKLRLRKCNI